ncbi:hypothetical protein [Rubellimicrobium aerolatum]|uniref:VPLPA-CTERM sorting domain-containing protein n=1 Tax=Rubellimicrobium aerolatum TaxID=490979 RepID=A0ABW0SEP1_9RHOB|nr:hypothetical protein [Rubellimicrobium aerolatum]MBP1806912.1 hypothetical protein [Rubellimicrobium aerolatum]
MKLPAAVLMLAAVLGMAAPVHAVPVTFEVSTVGDFQWVPYLSYRPQSLVGREGPGRVRVRLDLESLVSVDYTNLYRQGGVYSYGPRSAYESDPGTLISATARLGRGYRATWGEPEVASVYLKTDTQGNITQFGGAFSPGGTGNLPFWLFYEEGRMRVMGRTQTYWTAPATLDVKVHGRFPKAGLAASTTVPAPVPLPASVTLLGAALAGIGALGWRRRRARA